MRRAQQHTSSTRYDGLAVDGGVVDGVDGVPDGLVREARDAPVRQSPVAESEGAPIRRKEVPEDGIRVVPGDVPDRDGEPETGNVQVGRRLNSVRELLQVARGPEGHGGKAPQERQGHDQRLRCDDSRHDDDDLLLLLLLCCAVLCSSFRRVARRVSSASASAPPAQVVCKESGCFPQSDRLPFKVVELCRKRVLNWVRPLQSDFYKKRFSFRR